MPTVISHAIVGAGGFLSVGHGRPGARVGACVAAALAVVPDADALVARWIPGTTAWAHRGVSHSLLVAVLLGFAGALALRRRVALPDGPWTLAVLLAAIVATHGVLDAMTEGGEGVAFFAPIVSRRYFLPWRPIPVAPLVLHPMLVEVLLIEAWMLWPVSVALATARARLRPAARAAVWLALAASVAPWWIGMGLRPA